MTVIGISSARIESTTQRGGMSRSVRSRCCASCDARVEAANAPRSEAANDERIENIVLAAPTSIVPTAIGRTMLNQSVYDASAGSLDADARAAGRDRRTSAAE